MNDGNYAINKYYKLVWVSSNTRSLMERFMVVRIVMDSMGITFTEEVYGDNFSSYKDAFDYIEELFELPQTKDGE